MGGEKGFSRVKVWINYEFLARNLHRVIVIMIYAQFRGGKGTDFLFENCYKMHINGKEIAD